MNKYSDRKSRYKPLPYSAIVAATHSKTNDGGTIMNKCGHRNPRYKLLPYSIILAATQGDPDAIAAVLHHYEGYIAKLSLRNLYDEHGNVCLCVDETRKHRLEIKLITGLLAFKVA